MTLEPCDLGCTQGVQAKNDWLVIHLKGGIKGSLCSSLFPVNTWYVTERTKGILLSSSSLISLSPGSLCRCQLWVQV